MRITRIYQDTDLALNKSLALDKCSSHYLARVMRCTIGDTCHVFNGKGLEFKAEIILIKKNNIDIILQEKINNTSESPLAIHLFQGLCKGDKMDLILQKSIELGTTEITPIFSQNCDVKLTQERINKKMQHWNKIIISATEQCGRAALAKLNQPVNFSEILKSKILMDKKNNYLLSPRAKLAINKIPNQEKKINIFIGPEGGFSENEEKQAIKLNINLLKLGPRILRTETAALATISALQSHWGDF